LSFSRGTAGATIAPGFCQRDAGKGRDDELRTDLVLKALHITADGRRTGAEKLSGLSKGRAFGDRQKGPEFAPDRPRKQASDFKWRFIQIGAFAAEWKRREGFVHDRLAYEWRRNNILNRGLRAIVEE
jgi:hypothetical protein